MSNCKLILRGVKQGLSVDEVVEALARFSKKPPDHLRALLLGGKHAVAKRTADIPQAMKYKKMLEDIGCVCVIEAEISGSQTPESITASLTNLTEATVTPSAVGRENRYAPTPLRVRMKMLRLPVLTVVLILLACAWQRFG